MTLPERKALLLKAGFEENISDVIVTEIWDLHLIKFYENEAAAVEALKGWGKKAPATPTPATPEKGKKK